VTLRPWEESRAAPIVRGVAWVVLVLRVADGGASGDDVLPTFSTVPVLPVIVSEPSRLFVPGARAARIAEHARAGAAA
jgi:hypothetical protein